MIAKCNQCDKRATWCDLLPIKDNINYLACDTHAPSDKDKKGRKWTYSECGWVPTDLKGWLTKSSNKKEDV